MKVQRGYAPSSIETRKAVERSKNVILNPSVSSDSEPLGTRRIVQNGRCTAKEWYKKPTTEAM